MVRLVPLTNIPPTPRKEGEAHVCRFGPPLRKSVRTEDGWIDREWEPGERSCYAAEVLGQRKEILE